MDYELQYHTFLQEQSGLNVKEYKFAELKDFFGKKQTYFLDLILPEKRSDKKMPVVFFIHSGGFVKSCNKRQAYISLFAKELISHGYAVVSPDYPLYDTEQEMLKAGGFPSAFEICAETIHKAYRYICEHADVFSLDQNMISIMGGSAGAMAAFYAISNYQDSYHAFINLWGAPDPLPELCKFPPTLIVHGSKDTIVPCEREEAVIREFEKYKVDYKFNLLEGEGHTPLRRFHDFMPDILQIFEKTRRNADETANI